MYDAFLEAIPAPIANDPIYREPLLNRLQRLELEKGTVVLSQGEVCQACYFVEHGSLYQAHWDETGIERVSNLFGQHEWVLDHASFTGQKPAQYQITALETTVLFRLDIHDIHHLIETAPIYFSMGRILETVIPDPQLTAAHLKPEDKYTHLVQKHPHWLQQFPLKLIASYMGMTPETLSRVRRKLHP